MKFFILMVLLFLNIFALDNRKELLNSISQHAILIGNGENKVYAFIDPLCPKSQAFIELITSREDLKNDSSYFIFLYQLPSFSSAFLITHIYQSKSPLQSLTEVMVYEDYDVPDQEINKSTLEIIKSIKDVAKKMKIKSRPYLLMFDKDSKYCRVSEGTAPCLEENDF